MSEIALASNPSAPNVFFRWEKILCGGDPLLDVLFVSYPAIFQFCPGQPDFFVCSFFIIPESESIEHFPGHEQGAQ